MQNMAFHHRTATLLWPDQTSLLLTTVVWTLFFFQSSSYAHPLLDSVRGEGGGEDRVSEASCDEHPFATCAKGRREGGGAAPISLLSLPMVTNIVSASIALGVCAIPFAHGALYPVQVMNGKEVGISHQEQTQCFVKENNVDMVEC